MTFDGVTLGELADASGGTIVRGEPSLPITNLHYDSREIQPGGLFVALRGGYADGHDFVADALSRGAAATLVESIERTSEFDAVVQVQNTRQALSPLAARFYGYPGNDLGVIGITGTDGKTTTSYLIDAMLRHNGIRTGLVGTISIRIGDRIVDHDSRQTTPESLEIQRLLAEMRGDAVDWAILEATSHALALYRLSDCPFDIGVVTNVTREHLDFHGSIENYRRAKAQLVRRVEQGSHRSYPRFLVINSDDEGARSVAKGSQVPVVTFSLKDHSCDVFASGVRQHPDGTSFQVTIAGKTTDIDLKLIGAYNVFNAMAAAAVGNGIGLSIDEIRAGLESLEHVPGRMQRVDCGQPFNVIIDYAHSPASLEETLRLVRGMTSGRVIAVSGSAGERDRGKRPVQGKISAELADFSIFTSEDPRFEDPALIVREIATGAENAGFERGSAFLEIESRKEAIQEAMSRAMPGDSILLAGKGHETCMIYGDQRLPWNEEAEARRALNQLGYIASTPESEG